MSLCFYRSLLPLAFVLSLSFGISAQGDVKIKHNSVYIGSSLLAKIEDFDNGFKVKNADDIELFRADFFAITMTKGYHVITFPGIAQQGEISDCLYFKRQIIATLLDAGAIAKGYLNINGVSDFLRAHPVISGENRINENGYYLPNVGDTNISAGKMLDDSGLIMRDKNKPVIMETNVLSQDDKKIGTFKRERMVINGEITQVISYYLTTKKLIAEARIVVGKEKEVSIFTFDDEYTHAISINEPMRNIEIITSFLVKKGYL